MDDILKPKILIVDNEESIIRFLVKILSNSNFQPVPATDPDEALKLLKEMSIDILLVDLKMPKMNGIDLIERALYIQPKIISVIMTGHGSITSAVDAMKKGASDYILKPFDPENLLSTLTKLIESERVKKENIYLKKLISFYKFSEKIFSSKDINEILHIIENAFITILPITGIYMFLKTTPKENKINKIIGRNKKGQQEEISEQINNFAQRMIDDNQDYDEKIIEKIRYIGIALKSRDYTNGVIILVPEENISLNEQDLKILTILSDRAALSIENLWLLESLESSLETIQSQQKHLMDADRLSVLGEIASTFIHEISNPLAAMQMAFDYMRTIDSEPVSEKHQTAHSSIELGIKKIHDIIKSLKHMSKGEMLSLKKISLFKIVEDTEKLLSFLFKKNLIEFNNNLPSDIPLIYIDKGQMQQVLVNLFMNSIDALTHGGYIQVDGNYSEENNEFIMKISDNGIGISQENLPYIFNPFFTYKSGEKKGTGLGLAVVKKIITKHRGNIKAESDSDTGTVFIIKLPCKVIKEK